MRAIKAHLIKNKNSSAFGVTETVPLWMNLKDSLTQRPSVSQDSDYFYEYLDYQDNMSDTSASTPSSGVSTVSVPTQTVKIIHPPSQTQKHQTQKNVTLPGKRNPMIPASPSSSGFTFFGLPLPNLNFNLWGHSGRKAARKESSSDAGRSPEHRGRYRSFLPTEPEIHRGGFVPLPRAQSGFVPIADPRLMYEKNAKHGNISRSNGVPVSQEERPRKSGNNTVIRVEKTVSTTGKPRTNFRKKEESSTVSILDRTITSNFLEPRNISTNVNRIR